MVVFNQNVVRFFVFFADCQNVDTMEIATEKLGSKG